MKINIYYGGRGLIEDPTIYVINTITEVLKELRVEVTRYNLYEEKNNITTLPKTLKDADGIVLATTIEWMGIGGYMQQFLDACWLYGDKEKISKLYMLPVVIASTYGERDGELTLIKSWDILGGLPLYGLCAYVDENVEFETNQAYRKIIEKKAEYLYRNVNQKITNLPSSNAEVKKKLLRNNVINLTPQESEQLSMYVSDDAYVKKQKEDIEELTQMFKEMLSDNEESEVIALKRIREHFDPVEGFKASYALQLMDSNKNLIIEVDGLYLNCYFGQKDDVDVFAKTKDSVFEQLIKGQITFQHAFMTGEIMAKGNFKMLRSFDAIFNFKA